MKRFKNILVIFNNKSDNVITFQHANWIARNNKARLTIAEVLEEVPHYLVEIARKERTKFLKKTFKSAVKEGVTPKTTILIGTPFLEVIKEVEKENHDLVIMEPIKPIGVITRIFSSLSMHLIRKCPCPVWIMRPENIKDKDFKIMAAIDARADDETTDKVNKSIMALATSLAKSGECPLHIAHAWKHPWEEALKAEPEMTRKEKFNAINDVRLRRKEYLKKLVAHYDMENIETTIHLEKGEALDIIPSIIAKEDINLIIMGTVCRPSLVGLIVGNTCEDILQQVNCSVLALKPEDFQYPVEE